MLLWDLVTGVVKASFTVSDSGISCIGYAPSGDTIAIGDAAGELHLWEVTTRERRWTKRAHTGTVNTLRYSPSGEHIATGGDDLLVGGQGTEP